jgi:hypothetical protein
VTVSPLILLSLTRLFSFVHSFRYLCSSPHVSDTHFSHTEPSLLKSDGVYLIDSGDDTGVYVWLGRSSAGAARKYALQRAIDYLRRVNRPLWCALSASSPSCPSSRASMLTLSASPPCRIANISSRVVCRTPIHRVAEGNENAAFLKLFT